MDSTIVAGLLIGGVGAILAGIIAYSKTHQTSSFVAFFILGLILMPLALILACLVKAPTPPPQPPNWYPDPWAPGNIRWYDGTQWTYHTQPAQTNA